VPGRLSRGACYDGGGVCGGQEEAWSVGTWVNKGKKKGRGCAPGPPKNLRYRAVL
jgi:hypothetical protein